MFDNTKKYRRTGGPGGAEGKTAFNQTIELKAAGYQHSDEDFAACAALSVLWLALRDGAIRGDSGEILRAGGLKLGGAERMNMLRKAIKSAGHLQEIGEVQESMARSNGFSKDDQIFGQIWVIGAACGLTVQQVATVPSADMATVMTQTLPHGAYVLDYETGKAYSHTIACYSSQNSFYIFDPNCGEMRCAREKAYNMWAAYWEDVGELGDVVSDVRVMIALGNRKGALIRAQAHQPMPDDFRRPLAEMVKRALLA